MFTVLAQIMHRPAPFEAYTAADLWTDIHISEQMLKYHLDDSTELSSRNSDFIERSVAWMLERFKIGRGTRICDLGCGPGHYTTRLARAGAEVTGIDFSERSIQYARGIADQEKLAITYDCADYLDYLPEGPFDLITLIYCDYCVLNPQQRQSLLSGIRSRLRPDGHFFFDVCSLELFNKTVESISVEENHGGGFWSPKPHFVFNKTFRYVENDLILNKHTIIEADRARAIYNWLQCYDIETLQRELESVGLACDEYYANVAGDVWTSQSNEIAAVATVS